MGTRASTSPLKGIFLVAAPAAILLTVVLALLGDPLQTEDAPLGIVSFEFAGSLPRARQILDSWGPDGRVRAGLSLGLDFAYIPAYAAAIGCGCWLAGRALGRRLPDAGRAVQALGAAQALAAALDGVENVSLIRLLLGSTSGGWAAVA